MTIERQAIADAKKDFDDSADDGSEDEVKGRPKANVYDLLLGLSAVKSKLHGKMVYSNRQHFECVLRYLKRLESEGFVLYKED